MHKCILLLEFTTISMVLVQKTCFIISFYWEEKELTLNK
jgi:hypothetical protein